MLVKRSPLDSDGREWYDVLLPIRPDGASGWIHADDVQLVGVRYSLVVHLRSLRLDLYENGVHRNVIRIGVGKQNTPTPTGQYYIKELIKPPTPNTIYGDYVFGLNGFSNVLTNWPDGGVIGIHGTNDPSSIGRHVSHGCIRMSNRDIDALVRILPLGTPVRILDD
jgi:lipoprotein-anchoring transpeptidase ErfK/SrfK